MLCKYSLTAHCTCPVDATRDRYEIELESGHMVPVEDILAAVHQLSGPLYQEDFTAQLAMKVQCQVTSVGYHSGIKTVVVAP